MDHEGGDMSRSRSLKILEGGNDDDAIDIYEAAANKTARQDYEENVQSSSLLGSIPKWPIKSYIVSIIIGIFLIGVCLALVIPVLVLYTKNRKCDYVSSQLSKFAVVDVEYGAGVKNMSVQLRDMTEEVKKACDVIDTIYLKQVSNLNLALLENLRVTNRCAGKTLDYFLLNFGPWDRMNNNYVFVESDDNHIPDPKPAGSNLYPDDIDAQEFDTWENSLSPAAKKAATGPYFVVRRDRDSRKLLVNKYSDEYEEELKVAATHLNNAANLLTDVRTEIELRSFLTTRAVDLVDNEYSQSDAAYMTVDDVTSTMEIIIGPYDPREDSLLGYKLAFQSYIGVTDPEWSARAQKFTPFLQELQNNLPFDSDMSNQHNLTIGPVKIRVVDQIYSGGTSKLTITSRAFSFPADPVLFQTRGGKRVLLKNIQKAKYDTIMKKLSEEITYRFQLPYWSFDGYFFFIVQKEIMHGLGPQASFVNGEQVNFQTQFGALNLPLEEARADVASLWMTNYLIKNDRLNYNMNLTAEQLVLKVNQKMTDQEITRRSIYVSFLVGQFRKVRYGLDTYQSKGAVLVLSFLLEIGGVVIEHTSVGEEQVVRYSINFSRIDSAVETLMKTLMKIQHTGDVKAATTLFETYSFKKLDKNFIDTLASVANVPVDIKPRYPKY
ncbi:nudix hydrolase [Acrasis kona]|uniref:Nudix hydrolase n=1 Tax=Acrasis kona TaxID=1008807 RepID=A0AAW2ZR28_9EUKA